MIKILIEIKHLELIKILKSHSFNFISSNSLLLSRIHFSVAFIPPRMKSNGFEVSKQT